MLATYDASLLDMIVDSYAVFCTSVLANNKFIKCLAYQAWVNMTGRILVQARIRVAYPKCESPPPGHRPSNCRSPTLQRALPQEVSIDRSA